MSYISSNISLKTSNVMFYNVITFMIYNLYYINIIDDLKICVGPKIEKTEVLAGHKRV